MCRVQPLRHFFPPLTGFCVLADAGANVDCKPKHLLQFAIMGRQVMKSVFGRATPKIGILSIGEEATKGNELTLAASDLLKKHVPHFIGNVEGRDIPKGMADVVVCDGFVGNVVLKLSEGLAESLITLIKGEVSKSLLAKLGGLFMMGSLKEVKRKIDYAEYGGAPLLGVNGVCIICHGKSNKKAIYNAVRVAGQFVQSDTNRLIQEELLARPSRRWPVLRRFSQGSFDRLVHAEQTPYSHHWNGCLHPA